MTFAARGDSRPDLACAPDAFVLALFCAEGRPAAIFGREAGELSFPAPSTSDESRGGHDQDEDAPTPLCCQTIETTEKSEPSPM